MEKIRQILIILVIIILIVFIIKKINNSQEINIDNANSVDTFDNSNQVTKNKTSILSDEEKKMV